MGKNRVIESLANQIGNIVVHKILVKHTNKPESINKLKYEVIEYSDNTIESAQNFNWNEEEKEVIRSKALERFKNEMEKRYKDVKFPKDEADKLISETMGEVIA